MQEDADFLLGFSYFSLGPTFILSLHLYIQIHLCYCGNVPLSCCMPRKDSDLEDSDCDPYFPFSAYLDFPILYQKGIQPPLFHSSPFSYTHADLGSTKKEGLGSDWNSLANNRVHCPIWRASRNHHLQDSPGRQPKTLLHFFALLSRPFYGTTTARQILAAQCSEAAGTELRKGTGPLHKVSCTVGLRGLQFQEWWVWGHGERAGLVWALKMERQGGSITYAVDSETVSDYCCYCQLCTMQTYLSLRI